MNWNGGFRSRGFGQGAGRGGRGFQPPRTHQLAAPEQATVQDDSQQKQDCHLLELAKYLPQGQALFLQLSHQMEIHKRQQPRHPPLSLRRNTGTVNEAAGGSESSHSGIQTPFRHGPSDIFGLEPPDDMEDATTMEGFQVSSSTTSTPDGTYLTASPAASQVQTLAVQDYPQARPTVISSTVGPTQPK